MSSKFQIASLSPGLLEPSIAIATWRAGELGLLDFEYARDPFAIATAIERLHNAIHACFGIKLSGDVPAFLARVIAPLPDSVGTVILTSSRPQELEEHVRILHEMKIVSLLECTCVEHARIAEAIAFDGVIAKGHEAGGRVADETTFVLLQRFLGELGLPVWAYGGIGLHTAPACAAAGAAGIILDSQLALTRESPYNDAVKARVANMDGSETICLGEQLGEAYRIFARPGNPVVKELQELEGRLAIDERERREILSDWRQAIAERVNSESETNVLLLGQDAAFAAPLAKRFRTVGGVLQAVREAVRSHCRAADMLRPLAGDSLLARSHGTRYPILQGPMTRVSDVAEFAGRVGEEGALPFLALALMRGPEVRTLLAETRRRMGTMPWGVGILGFVPAELRQEQLEVIQQYLPPFALIAGGRPDQAAGLEQKGIATYLHVPSPGLLQMFIKQGARRFVFEGRECGGHVGPRTSFVLWNQMVDVLLAAPETEAKPQEFHVVFAAGIHDAISAAMVSVIAAPLAERGVRIGALLGTAYLFTEEAVASGAILRTFQEQAQQCRKTVLLETGPGHSTRCVDTPYAVSFAREKQRLSASGLSAEEVRTAMESLNLGRLRIASKGLSRHTGFGQDPAAPKLLEIDKNEQVAQGMYMIGQVAALRDTVCTIRELHHAVSVESSNKLQGLAERSWDLPASGPIESSTNVAIIGMACLLPKAPDLTTYWENIFHKVDAIREIPQERWDWNLYFDSDPKAKDKIYSRWGGFLEDIAFDPIQYGMPPASLRSIEPAQLLTLEVVRAALEDAGYLERPFGRDRTSVILGAGGGAADLGLGYGARSFVPVLENLPEFRGRSREILDRLGDRLPEWTEDSFAGILTNVSAGRVANRFDLGGSNYTVDAACASSLAAVSLALKELEGRTSDMVIVGGVDTMQNPFTYLCFSKTHALSPQGRCRAFDESADGIAISEGIAVLVLKRLEDAERDGDRIYAIIKGAGSSSDGRDRGLTAPRPAGQARALKRAYNKAGFSPATVGLIEAHGTGTVAGDGAEVQALTQVFSEAQARQQGCAIGSVKSMIGHTKCTAGAAGLVKAALALHHRVLPPTLGVEKPNPRARFPETPFFVNTEARPWLDGSNDHPRRAGVSAFGFGGTNFHVVLEEYTGGPSELPAPCRKWSEELFVWRGDSRQALLEDVEAWEKALTSGAKPPLRDLAYTAWKQAEEKTARGGSSLLQLAIIASSLVDLGTKLSSASRDLSQPETARINDPRGIYFSEQPLAFQGKLAFLFPGQGSQYPWMLQDLLLHFPEMRQVLEKAVRVLLDKLEQPLSAYVFPPPAFSREEEQTRQQALTRTNIAQPALGAVELAMLGLLEEFGLQPDMVAGHSYGEYVALTAAGVFNAETLIALSEARGRFIVEGVGAEPGIMAAVEAGAAAVAHTIENFGGVCLANANAPGQSVISGQRAAVQRAVEDFSARGITARMFPVACAFHSPLVAPAQTPLAQFLSTLNVGNPTIPVYSNTTAAPYPTKPDAVIQRLIEHLVQPVEFVREIESMYEAGARVFVEVGPRGVLTSLVDQILQGRPKLAVASNQSGRPGLLQLLHLLGQLSTHGCVLKLDRLYRDRSARRLNLGELQRESSDKPLASSVWMVNGSRAVPLKQFSMSIEPQRGNGHAPLLQKPPVETPPPELRPPAVASSASPSASGTPFSNTVPKATRALPPDPGSVPTPAGGTPSALAENRPNARLEASTSGLDGVAQNMVQFQQMMVHFLDTQKKVMLAYLGSESGTPAFAASLDSAVLSPVAHPATRTEPVMAAQPVSAASEAPVVPVAEAAPLRAEQRPAFSLPDKGELTAALLSIVSERTGYPKQMLDLNLDLEADLGIDSIKRVEILGIFQQQSFAAGGLGAEEGWMEKLSGVRTLGGIIDLMAKQLGDRSVEPYAAPAPTAGQAERPIHPQVAAGPNKEELLSRLLAIVSDRTGYPLEMLNLNLDLEADLSIDSIKRVEILGTLQQSFAAAGVRIEEGFMERLSGVRTLQAIIDRLCDPGRGMSAGARSEQPSATTLSKPAEPIPVATSSQNEEINRYALGAVEMPRSGVAKEIAKDRSILIVDGGHGVSGALTRALLSGGYKVATVRQGQGVQELDAASYAADLGSMDSVADLIELVRQRQGQLGGIVHLLSLEGQPSFEAHSYQSWKDQLRSEVKSLFLFAKAAGLHLREAARENAACLIAATGMGGAFLCDLPPDGAANFPDHGAIAGLIKTIALEWPEVSVKVVDLNLQETGNALAEHLVEELRAGDGLVEVGYNGQRRVTLQPVPAPLGLQVPTARPLDSSAVVLITGGARGITARAAMRLAELYQPTLLLAGRSPLPPAKEAGETVGINSPKELKAALMNQMRSRGETVTPALVERAYAQLTAEREIRGNLAELQKLGARVRYYPLDVRDANAFGSFIEDIYASFGRLDGVIHGAGVIEDKLIQDKTLESFDRVFDTKVDSAFVLSRKLRSESLKFLLFFSSVAGRFGNRGQGDYAAANEVLNKLAVCLDRAWPGRVVAINWGPWDTQGMVSAEVRQQFAERGVKLISPEIGLRRLEEEIHCGSRTEAEIVIGGVEGHIARRRIAAHGRSPLLRNAVMSRSETTLDFVRELDPAYDLYLNDHQLDGQPVLPFAVATEFIVEAVAEGWPQMQVAAVQGLRTLHGVVLERGTRTVRIAAKAEGGSASNPSSVAVEVRGDEHPHRLHYRAIVELSPRLPHAPTVELTPLADGRKFSMEIAEIYRQWLFHGPMFQGIKRADLIGLSGVKALLAASSPSGWIAGGSQGHWLIDPLMFDSALQLLVLWAREHWDMTALPSGFRRFRRFAAPAASRILCEVRVRPETGAQTIHADIFFIDAVTGGVVGIVEDMQGACSKALNRLARRELAIAVGSDS